VVPTDCGYSQDFIDLIKIILKSNPKQRLTFEAIMKHIWFRAVRDIDVVNIEEFERQHAEEGQLNQGQRVPDEGQ
jgi:serine/threonine protein kinase